MSTELDRPAPPPQLSTYGPGPRPTPPGLQLVPPSDTRRGGVAGRGVAGRRRGVALRRWRLVPPRWLKMFRQVINISLGN